jgi:NAD(P)-dependent dehydrogenase (short-subunit alcohol dehydrogenase family)
MSTEHYKQYWLTGAGSGIGRELAMLLAQAGHRVYVSGRSLAALESLAACFPGQLLPLPCDVSNDQQMQELFATLPEPPAWLDGIILSAGICEYIDLPNLDVGSIRRVHDCNFFGVVNACRVALPLLQAARQRNPSRKPEIIGVGSMSSYVGFARAEGYGASKAAMSYFLQALRCDLQGEIAVTVAYPGFVATPMTKSNDFPMPFLLTAAEAAQCIMRNMGKGKFSVYFPMRLHLLLKFAALLPGFWYGPFAKFLNRKRS